MCHARLVSLSMRRCIVKLIHDCSHYSWYECDKAMLHWYSHLICLRNTLDFLPRLINHDLSEHYVLSWGCKVAPVRSLGILDTYSLLLARQSIMICQGNNVWIWEGNVTPVGSQDMLDIYSGLLTYDIWSWLYIVKVIHACSKKPCLITLGKQSSVCVKHV